MTKTVAIEGNVVQFKWQNPHAWIEADVPARHRSRAVGDRGDRAGQPRAAKAGAQPRPSPATRSRSRSIRCVAAAKAAASVGAQLANGSEARPSSDAQGGARRWRCLAAGGAGRGRSSAQLPNRRRPTASRRSERGLCQRAATPRSMRCPTGADLVPQGGRRPAQRLGGQPPETEGRVPGRSTRRGAPKCSPTTG